MNLYVHFPFCRRKCAYCVLYSRVGSTQADRAAYVDTLAGHLARLLDGPQTLDTLYFGGGSPALCDLAPLAPALGTARRTPHAEFTVELHPLDVTEDKLLELRDLGVNRISMGVQSLDDRILASMGRNYDSATAARAFAHVKRHFDNAGIDLIVGYPGERPDLTDLQALRNWGLRHCSAYALQNERRLENVPDDETTMDRLAAVGQFLESIGLARYEISNYAAPGFECRHNFAVWRGEDYIGLGDGAAGRVGLSRTLNFGGRNPKSETVSPARDVRERTLFRLRTREGLDASRHPEWVPILARFAAEGLLRPAPDDGSGAVRHVYVLTPRGMEVCDTILAELV